jgi:hypothetical protein
MTCDSSIVCSLNVPSAPSPAPSCDRRDRTPDMGAVLAAGSDAATIRPSTPSPLRSLPSAPPHPHLAPFGPLISPPSYDTVPRPIPIQCHARDLAQQIALPHPDHPQHKLASALTGRRDRSDSHHLIRCNALPTHELAKLRQSSLPKLVVERLELTDSFPVLNV